MSHLLLSFMAALSPWSAPHPQQQGLPQGVTREQMWFAPTAEDWARPCLIQWQRNWDDAMAVALETGKPILVCVNMDGEIASEHYAGVRYRDPEIAALYEPYVCVIASVYRHTPNDYAADGTRIECPRFGGVTCGEHIAIEPILYQKFLDGKRVAPRHIMVELDGSETYDVFYAWDTDSVFRAIREGIAQRERKPNPPRGDRSLLDRVASRDAADRQMVENAYRQGDRALKTALLEAALQHPEAEGTGLLRLALYDLDENLNKIARQGLAQSNQPAAIDLINQALRGAIPETERAALIAALKRIGGQSVRARTLATVQEGLGATTGNTLDAGAWASAFEGNEYPPPPGADQIAEQLATAESANAAVDSPQALTELALQRLAYAVSPATLDALARDPRTAQRFDRLHHQDALDTAYQAEAAGADDWRLDAVIAVASWHLGDQVTAHARAEKAVRRLPAGEPSWNAMAVLDLFADARRRAISEAIAAKQDWPPEWMRDLHQCYAILAQHPLGNVVQVMTHHDFLVSLGAYRQASQALKNGLKRYPESWDLHARLRQEWQRDRGIDGMVQAYGRWLEQPDAPPHLSWFAGYASIQAAEAWRRSNQPKRAMASYQRADQLYQRAMDADPAVTDSSHTYQAMIRAGQARLAMEAEDLTSALSLLLESFRLDSAHAAVLDGLNLSAYVTSVTLHARLLEAGRTADAARLQQAIDALPPEARQRPAYDTPGAPSQDASRFGGGG